ncbi:MAG: RHS repeat protein [Armatimonadetes bacterium]|nr:RHS repeat protein [Armatimonadota bacterium]
MLYSISERASDSTRAGDELTRVTPPVGQPTTLTWDANGNLLAENAGGQRTTYTWDDENRLTNLVYADGTRETYPKDT